MDLADVTMPGQGSTLSSYLRLKLDNQFIAILLHQIYTVIPIVELQKVPNDDPALSGVFNYYGQPVAVYHLSELINEPRPQYDINSLLLLSQLSSQLEGFLVSEEIDIISNAKELIQSSPIKNKPYVNGIIEHERWSAWILDLDKLLHFHKSFLEKTP